MKVGAYGERGSTSKRGLEADPPVGIGAEPLVRGSGGKAPETEVFSFRTSSDNDKMCLYGCIWKSVSLISLHIYLI